MHEKKKKKYKKGTLLQKGSGIVELHSSVGLRCKKKKIQKRKEKVILGLFISRLKYMCQARESETQTVITLEQFEAGVERCIVILMARMGRA